MGVRWSHKPDSLSSFPEIDVFWLMIARTSKERREHLLAAINLGSGHVTSLRVGRRTSESLARFLEQLVQEYPRTRLLLVCQRETTRLTKRVVRFLKTHQGRIAVSFFSKPSRADEGSLRAGEGHGDFQFVSGSPQVLVTQIQKGIKQIEQLLRL
jgi:hypothetical protein